MAKENWLKEVKRSLYGLETGSLREQLPKTDVHRLTMDVNTVAKAFKAALSIKARKGGLKEEDLYINGNYINSLATWIVAFNTAWSKSKTDGTFKQTTGFNNLSSLGAFKGLYIEEDTVSKKVILQAATDDVGAGASAVVMRKSGKRQTPGFDSKFRQKVWKAWYKASGLEGSNLESNINKTVPGTDVPTAHTTTLGEVAVKDWMENLGKGIDQAEADAASIFGTFISEQTFTDVRQKILDSIKVNYSQEFLPDYKTGKSKMTRIIEVELVDTETNKNDPADLQRLKPSIYKKIDKILSNIEPMDKRRASTFEGSKKFTKESADVAGYAIVENMTKKSKTAKKTKGKKPRKTPAKKIPLIKNKRYKPTKLPGFKINDVAPVAVSKRLENQKRKATDNILKITRLINKRLPAEVRRNMGKPALTNRTGIFSNSAELVSLRQTKAGLSGEYTYMRTGGGTSKNRGGVYETFENTGKYRWPTGYNPKPLIAKSIRNLAMQYTEQKLVSLRRV